MSEAAQRTEVREAALRLLARREHAYAELVRKLGRRGWPSATITAVLDELAGAGLQSDQRYAESYARSRVGKGYGPVRIGAELVERGIERRLAEQTLNASETDWLALAADWYARRYRGQPPADMKEKSRRQQALSRRGFGHEQIRQVVEE